MDINLKPYTDTQKIRIMLRLCIKCAEPLPEDSTELKCIKCDKSRLIQCNNCGKIFKYKVSSNLCYRCRNKAKRLNRKNETKVNTIKIQESKTYMGTNIKRIRKIKNLKVAELAESISVKPYRLYRIESGKIEICLSEFVKIYKALNIDYSIFNLEENELYGKLYLRFKSSIIELKTETETNPEPLTENTGHHNECVEVLIEENIVKQQPITLTEKEKQVSVKDFYLQLEINHAIKTSNCLGFNIKRIRKIKKLSVSNLSKITGISVANITKIESGEKKITSFQFAEIAKGLGITSEMFGIRPDRLYSKLFLHFKKRIIDINCLM